MDEDHYLIAWMNMWGRNNPSSKYGYAGMLTAPRKVEVKDGLMLQTPVIFGKLAKTVDIKNTYEDHISVGTLKLEVEHLKSLFINLREGNGEVTKFYLKGDEFYFDRSKSGEIIAGEEKDELSLKCIRKMPYLKKEKDIIYIVMDKYSIEIFVNGISMSNVIYPKDNSDAFKIDVSSIKSKLMIYR